MQNTNKYPRMKIFRNQLVSTNKRAPSSSGAQVISGAACALPAKGQAGDYMQHSFFPLSPSSLKILRSTCTSYELNISSSTEVNAIPWASPKSPIHPSSAYV
jgi:hypothetical protein